MSDPFGGQSGKRKADGVADAINRLLRDLVIKCSKSEGVGDYYQVGVIGYGSQVAPALGGTLAGRALVPVSEIGNAPLRVEDRTKKVEDGAGGLVDQTVKFPVWFDAVASDGTPMCQALDLARQTVADFISRYPDCFPPMVVNITDGESTDGSPEAAAATVRGLASSDGNVLLFNAHIPPKSTKTPRRPIRHRAASPWPMVRQKARSRRPGHGCWSVGLSPVPCRGPDAGPSGCRRCKPSGRPTWTAGRSRFGLSRPPRGFLRRHFQHIRQGFAAVVAFRQHPLMRRSNTWPICMVGYRGNA